MTGFYPQGIALHEKLQRLVIEAGQCPLTLGDAWKSVGREREVSNALKAYAAMTTSASRGAVRDVSQL